MYNKIFPVYCICLPERRKNTEKFFEAINITPIYTPVFFKNDLDKQQLIDNNIIDKWYNFESNRGRIACSLSHYNALYEFKKSGLPFCLIFEDDNIIPTENEVEYIHSILDNILYINGWNLINLSPCNRECILQNDSKISSYLQEPLKSQCRNAYAITQQGATEYLEKMFPLTIMKYAGDHEMKNISNGYDCVPRLFIQNIDDFTTTLNNNNQTTDCILSVTKYDFTIYYIIILIIIMYILLKN